MQTDLLGSVGLCVERGNLTETQKRLDALWAQVLDPSPKRVTRILSHKNYLTKEKNPNHSYTYVQTITWDRALLRCSQWNSDNVRCFESGLVSGVMQHNGSDTSVNKNQEKMLVLNGSVVQLSNVPKDNHALPVLVTQCLRNCSHCWVEISLTHSDLELPFPNKFVPHFRWIRFPSFNQIASYSPKYFPHRKDGGKGSSVSTPLQSAAFFKPGKTTLWTSCVFFSEGWNLTSGFFFFATVLGFVIAQLKTAIAFHDGIIICWTLHPAQRANRATFCPDSSLCVLVVSLCVLLSEFMTMEHSLHGMKFYLLTWQHHTWPREAASVSSYCNDRRGSQSIPSAHVLQCSV